MGIDNRDYVRETDGQGGLWSDTPTCRNILFVTVVVFLAQLFFLRAPSNRLPEGEEIVATEMEQMPRLQAKESVVEEWFKLDTDKVLHGQVWRLGTTALLHDRHGLWHILINMIVLIFFGRSLESNYGSREFLLFYILAAIIGSLAFIAIQLFTGDRTPAIGASGAVMAVFCLFALWNPGYTVNVYMLIPVPIIWLLGLYVLYDLHPLILQLTGNGWRTGVAHAAHLGGVAFGYCYFRRSWNLESIVDRFLPAPSIPNQPKPIQLHRESVLNDRQEQELDAVLEKISREGEASLTDKERKILADASQRYKNRR